MSNVSVFHEEYRTYPKVDLILTEPLFKRDLNDAEYREYLESFEFNADLKLFIQPEWRNISNIFDRFSVFTLLTKHWKNYLVVIGDTDFSGAFWSDSENRKLNPRPLDMMTDILKAFPGKTVLDPFMGYGTTGLACLELGRDFVGFEKEKRFFDAADAAISRYQHDLSRVSEKALQAV